MVYLAKFMRPGVLSILISLAVSSPATAQDVLFSSDHSLNCMRDLTEDAPLDACFGVSAEVCMAQTPGGFSQFTSTACLVAEAEFWDGQMRNSLQFLMAVEAHHDAQAEAGAPSQADTLDRMQANWLSYREARCTYEAAQAGHDADRGRLYADCVLRLTAAHTHYLQQMSAM